MVKYVKQADDCLRCLQIDSLLVTGVVPCNNGYFNKEALVDIRSGADLADVIYLGITSPAASGLK